MTLDMAGIDRLLREGPAAFDEALLEIGNQIADEARARAPVRTGRLRDSLIAEATGPGEVEVHDGVSYGLIQEMGSRYVAPRPFLAPAVDSARDRFPELVGGVVRRVAGETKP